MFNFVKDMYDGFDTLVSCNEDRRTTGTCHITDEAEQSSPSLTLTTLSFRVLMYSTTAI